jgi:hypothetical protein
LVSLVVAGLAATACGSSSSSGGSSGSSSTPAGSSTSGTSPSGAGGGGSCTGDVTACTLGSLSDAQRADACNSMLASIDAPAGTKFECQSGPEQGQFITINSKEQCASQKFPASCPVTVQQTIDCYKAVKNDACAALASDGPCGIVLAKTQQCSS